MNLLEIQNLYTNITWLIVLQTHLHDSVAQTSQTPNQPYNIAVKPLFL